MKAIKNYKIKLKSKKKQKGLCNYRQIKNSRVSNSQKEDRQRVDKSKRNRNLFNRKKQSKVEHLFWLEESAKQPKAFSVLELLNATAKYGEIYHFYKFCPPSPTSHPPLFSLVIPSLLKNIFKNIFLMILLSRIMSSSLERRD